MARFIFQSVFKDGMGRIIPSATVSVYLAGTVTAANVYAAATGGSPVTSVTTAADGSFSFFVSDSDFSLNQRFKITMTKTDFATKSYDNITIFAPVPTGIYYPDANATDQGAATTGGYSLKDIIDAAGSNNITIKFRNSSGSATTSYTLTTSETIPATCAIELEIGAMIVQGGSAVLTINAPVVGNPMHQWLSGFAAGEVVFGVGKIQAVFPQWWGAYTDQTHATETTLAIHCAIRAFNVIRFSRGNYTVTGIIVNVDTLPDGQIYFIGDDWRESRLTLDASVPSGTCLKIIGLTPATPQTYNDTFTDLVVSNMSFVGINYTSVGIDGNALYRANFHNVWSTGHKYGFKLRNCIMVNFSGITDVADNVIGIKVPAYNVTGATIDTYNFGANVTGFEHLNARVCHKAAVSWGCGNNLEIGTMLAEGVPVIFYMGEYCDITTVRNLYLEYVAPPSAGTYAVKDKFGNYRHWVIYMGKDEDGNISGSGSNRAINMNIPTYTSNAYQYHFNNCYGADIGTHAGEGSVELDGECNNIKLTSLSAINVTNTILPGIGRSTSKRNMIHGSYNLVSNGLNTFPNISGHDSTGTLERTTATLDNGSTANVLRLTIAPGVTNAQYKVRLPRTKDGDYDNPGQMSILAEAHVVANSSVVSNIALQLTNHAGTQLGLTNLTDYDPVLTSTDWNVITVTGTTSITDSQEGSYLLIIPTRSNTTGTDYIYIQEVIARDAYSGYIESPSVFDYLAGFCYRGTTSVSDAGRFYVQFTVPEGLYYSTYYEVIATAYGTANEGVSVVKANGSFKVYTTSTGISVVAQLIPLQAISA